ncbi:MAG: tRNA (guanosine(37)-N1)-methyltransferase TrmD [Candidatus Sungbacteria bacterium RIFCSPHIGHO2_01_FULL_54_26]|uniref:tRNA (guanine-N(1)-)-methyltransferase n=1 Tax=Candidatus Sungbacteria bacterium RIFCSPHIGHO2_02_FULL_53_17 TaxID=1802275 RepID=A0A1G2KXV8_9BACT|nr:MAG: tRNA (guanosine(37)-N1)-methyltransferase TrmD [Candidatus Sungbacteria bacterium RIFCSPHIGHO2_01_FULL_54_26]OHA03279.1 MAG: tRNA (guanosine(37)-N1)-methyltransferase TrmD [Candidatus Sungbacteria bacterium RIFCSPHIGHO2_02_FULL_53_17]
MRFDVITLFPEICAAYLGESILKRAQEKQLLSFFMHNPRDYTKDAHRRVDGRAYGGGPGMVIRADAIVAIIASALKSKKFKSLKETKIILFSAGGKQFNAKMAAAWAKKYNRMIMIAGRYEGVDERIKKIYKMKEISVGPYVLTGGELPALVVIDAVSRHVPGVLGKHESLEERRLGVGVPVYTRPEVLVWKKKKYRVPPVLLSGDHRKIEEWRKRKKK